MVVRQYIKCRACGSVTLLRFEVGWLDAMPFAVGCKGCGAILRGKLIQDQKNVSLEQSDVMIKEFCQKLSHKLTNLSMDEKRLVLDVLQVKLIAYHDHLDLRGVLPTYVTTEQISSLCLS